MKRIPFTIEAWKAGGVPVTRSGYYPKPEDLHYFHNAKYPIVYINANGYVCSAKSNGILETSSLSNFDLFLEVPCTKYYTHYYRDKMTKQFIGIVTNTNKHSSELEYYEYIKTVEVEL